jgi:hypothetical protein
VVVLAMKVYFLLLILLFIPQPVFAHARSTSYSTLEIDRNQVRVTVRVPWTELQRALPLFASFSPQLLPESEFENALRTYLLTHVTLFSGEQPCTPSSADFVAVRSSDPTRIIREWTLNCPETYPLRLRSDAFFDMSPAHLHFARIRIDGATPTEKLFSVTEREWRIAAPQVDQAVSGTQLLDYLWLGVTHILGGLDHLLFLLALLMLGGSGWQIARLVTGFTVAHSITLALGVLNVVRPASVTVEALIGLSIALVAIENFWLTTPEQTRGHIFRVLLITVGGTIAAAALGSLRIAPLVLLGLGIFSLSYLFLLRDADAASDLRWFVAFVFGLVHGFGFAGAIAEMVLPANRIASALFGFNLGVELGQLAVVILVWPLLSFLNHSLRAKRRTLLIQASSAIILAIGIFWFLTRAVAYQ